MLEIPIHAYGTFWDHHPCLHGLLLTHPNRIMFSTQNFHNLKPCINEFKIQQKLKQENMYSIQPIWMSEIITQLDMQEHLKARSHFPHSNACLSMYLYQVGTIIISDCCFLYCKIWIPIFQRLQKPSSASCKIQSVVNWIYFCNLNHLKMKRGWREKLQKPRP